MPRFSATSLISLGLACMTITIMLAAHALGLMPDHNSALKLTGFVAISSFVCFLIYLRRTLRHLDPCSVTPPRVRAILNSLAEGVIVLDRDERIVLANEAFAQKSGLTVDELQGRRASELPWAPRDGAVATSYPWLVSIRDGETSQGVPLKLHNEMAGPRIMMVNAAPILGMDGKKRGALATFNDVTSVEDMNAQLRIAVDALKAARDEVDRQNDELQILANRDPLTGCLNRRAFMKGFDDLWARARRTKEPLGCVMVDIDHFKSVNDHHGHPVGDAVLKQMGDVLRCVARERDMVCRFGGEEFCILLPGMDAAQSLAFAEEVRHALASHIWPVATVTASLGISATELGARSTQELLDQADKALYGAKRSGRNRSMRFDALPWELHQGMAGGRMPISIACDEPVSPQMVGALVLALAHRDSATADHSKRVAELCETMAERRGLPPTERLLVKYAAVLHDIGKLGIDDAVLLKPGPLTEPEWSIMRGHVRRGADIVEAVFNCPALTKIVALYHAWFGGTAAELSLPVGESIPLGARLLAVADAFDAMTSDRVFRRARSQADAIEELRREAGTRFDPAIVDLLVEIVRGRDTSDQQANQLMVGLPPRAPAAGAPAKPARKSA